MTTQSIAPSGPSSKPGRRRTGTLVCTRGVWYLRVMVGGKLLWRSLGTRSKAEAEGKRLEALAELGVLAQGEAEVLARVRDRLEPAADRARRQAAAEQGRRELVAVQRQRVALDQTWAVYLAAESRPDTGAAALVQYRYVWGAFVEWLSGRGVEHLAELTPEVMAGYSRQLRARGLAPKTQNNHLQVVGMVLKHLPASEGVQPNLLAGIRRRVAVELGRQEIPLAKLAEVCEAATGELKVLLFLGLYTGLRLKDCALLSWDAVDLVRGVIRHAPYKTRRQSHGELLHIPVHRDLRPLLEAIPERCGPVLPETAEQYARRPLTIANRVQRLMAAAGLEMYHDASLTPGAAGARRRPRYGFHSLRHSAVTLWQLSGAPQAAVMALVGHHSRAMTARYTHVGAETLRATVDRLPSLTNTLPQLLPADAETERLRDQLRQELAAAAAPAVRRALVAIKS